LEEKISKNKIKWVNSLKLKKNRVNSDYFIVEGDKMTAEMIEFWGDYIDLIITTKNDIQTSLNIAYIDDVTMKKMTSLSTPSHTLIIAKKPINTFPEKGLFLLLDEVQDPGNMGTIIRTADWFGVSGIICSTGCVDIYNSKVIQSSMGSIFRMPTKSVDFNEFLPSISEPIYGALLEGENVYQSDLKNDTCYLMMGNEGNGINPNYLEFISHKVKIPQFGKAESLNVAIATGVLLSEFKRG